MVIERISNLTIVLCCAVLHVYWLRCACLLLFSKAAATTASLPVSFDSDMTVARTLLYNVLGPENWAQRLDYRLLDWWCRLNRPFSIYAAREVLEDMGVVLAGVARTLASSADWGDAQGEPLAWGLRRPATADPLFTKSKPFDFPDSNS